MQNVKLFFLLFVSAISMVGGLIHDRKTVKAGGEIEIKCESDVPIHWCFPPHYETPDESESIVYSSPTEMKYSINQKYEATIKVKSANYMYTGFYHCMRNDTDSPCNRDVEETVKSTYVYVEDPENLMVIKSHKIILVYSNSSAVLPCLPTSPKVVIQLKKGGEEIKVGKQPESEKTVTYDPTIGYLIEPFSVRDSDDYHCIATLKNKEEELICDVRAAGKERVTQLTSPTITRLSKIVKQTALHDGDRLTMVCHSSQKTKFNIAWRYPNQTMPQVEMHECQERSAICMSNSTLTIDRVSISDSGNYTCVVSAHNLKRVRTTVEVLVVPKDVKIDEDGNNAGTKMAASYAQHICIILILHSVLNSLIRFTS